jgi:hypothetical protein
MKNASANPASRSLNSSIINALNNRQPQIDHPVGALPNLEVSAPRIPLFSKSQNFGRIQNPIDVLNTRKNHGINAVLNASTSSTVAQSSEKIQETNPVIESTDSIAQNSNKKQETPPPTVVDDPMDNINVNTCPSTNSNGGAANMYNCNDEFIGNSEANIQYMLSLNGPIFRLMYAIQCRDLQCLQILHCKKEGVFYTSIDIDSILCYFMLNPICSNIVVWILETFIVGTHSFNNHLAIQYAFINNQIYYVMKLLALGQFLPDAELCCDFIPMFRVLKMHGYNAKLLHGPAKTYFMQEQQHNVVMNNTAPQQHYPLTTFDPSKKPPM